MARAILVTLVAWRCLASSCWSRKFQVPSAQTISLFIRFSLLRRSSRAIVQATCTELCEQRDLSQAHDGKPDLLLIWDKHLAANRLTASITLKGIGYALSSILVTRCDCDNLHPPGIRVGSGRTSHRRDIGGHTDCRVQRGNAGPGHSGQSELGRRRRMGGLRQGRKSVNVQIRASG